MVKKEFLKVVKYGPAMVIGFALLFLAFRNVNFSEFIAKTKEVNFSYIYISMAISVIPYWLRAYRWNILLETMGYPELKASRTSVAVVIGYLANLALPRMGEITRCGVLNRTDAVKVSAGIGTVILERIIDSLTLLLIIGITFVLEFERLKTFFTAHIFSKLNISITNFWIFILLAVLVLCLGIILWKKFMNTNGQSKVVGFIKETIAGLLSIKNIKKPVGFILATFLIWFFYFWMSYIIVFSLPETSHLDWKVGLALLVTGGLGMAAPVQGGIGTFHLFVSAMLISYGIESQTGLFLATLLHTSQVLAVVLIGAVALLVSFIMRRNSNINEQV